jgi:OOP family OmpA-OmpF porin
MKKIVSMMLVGACGVLLGGCATYDLAGVKKMEATGSAFSQELYREYLYLAVLEDKENDYPSVPYFLDKAKRAAGGEEVPPIEVADRKLPEDGVATATLMREQLEAKRGMAAEYPRLVARLQAQYECYVEEKSENNQPKEIHDCQEEFEELLAQFPAPPMVRHVELSADALFAFDKATLRPRGVEKLDMLVHDLGDVTYDTIVVVGHTDPLGSDAYNQGLSERRAATVAHYLTRNGVRAKTIRSEGRGESELKVTPADCSSAKGRAALIACYQPNRRVDVTVTGVAKQ